MDVQGEDEALTAPAQGAPIIAFPGDGVVSRFAASALTALNFGDETELPLVAKNLRDYEKRAIDLASCVAQGRKASLSALPVGLARA